MSLTKKPSNRPIGLLCPGRDLERPKSVVQVWVRSCVALSWSAEESGSIWKILKAKIYNLLTNSVSRASLATGVGHHLRTKKSAVNRSFW